jgi:hypothetical protein
MKAILEQKDYINAVTPFRNGCAFRAVVKNDGKVLLEPGCYLLINLISGADKVIYDMWLKNGEEPVEVEIEPETAKAIKDLKPCKWCNKE